MAFIILRGWGEVGGAVVVVRESLVKLMKTMRPLYRTMHRPRII